MVPLKFMWLQHRCPTSITNCATAHLVWSCLLSACPSLLWDHLERTSPSIRWLVSSHGGTCPTEETDETSCFPTQHQQGPGLIALLKMLRPDGNSHLEETLQNTCIHRTLLSKTKKRSLVLSLKPASALIWLQASLFLLCSLQYLTTGNRRIYQSGQALTDSARLELKNSTRMDGQKLAWRRTSPAISLKWLQGEGLL